MIKQNFNLNDYLLKNVIYEIVNLNNDKKYIGQTTDIFTRITNHSTSLKRNKHGNKYLQNAYNKNGYNCFEVRIIEECSIELLTEREIYWINYHETYKNKYKGYNLTPGGESLSNKDNPMYGRCAYDVWIEKYGIEEANKRKKELNEYFSSLFSGENNPMYGKKIYDVWVEKYGIKEANKLNKKWKSNISKTLLKRYSKFGHHLKGYKHTEETKVKMKESRLGNKNPMYGKTLYDVWVEKYGIKEADKKMEEYKMKQSIVGKGKRMKLTIEQQNEVRAMYKSGNFYIKDIAKKYAVHITTISNILKQQ